VCGSIGQYARWIIEVVRPGVSRRRDEGAGAGRGAVRAAGRPDGAPPPLRQGNQKQTQTHHLRHPQQQSHLRRERQRTLFGKAQNSKLIYYA